MHKEKGSLWCALSRVLFSGVGGITTALIRRHNKLALNQTTDHQSTDVTGGVSLETDNALVMIDKVTSFLVVGSSLLRSQRLAMVATGLNHTAFVTGKCVYAY